MLFVISLETISLLPVILYECRNFRELFRNRFFVIENSDPYRKIEIFSICIICGMLWLYYIENDYFSESFHLAKSNSEIFIVVGTAFFSKLFDLNV